MLEARRWLSQPRKFQTEHGLRTVHEIQDVPCISTPRALSRRAARCEERNEDFDVRLLRVASEGGGLVTLARLEALEMEVEAMTAVTPHVHVVHCHSVVIENVGHAHLKVLLCDPTIKDLALHLRRGGGSALQVGEAAEIGQQVAFGMGHLHMANLLYGSSAPEGILRGRDGFWKLGDFSRAARLGTPSSEWRERCQSSACGAPSTAEGSGVQIEEVPPEASKGEAPLSPFSDVYLLGRLLALLALASFCASSALREVMQRPLPDLLLEPERARLWLLLRWLLAAEPHARPEAKSVASLLGALPQTLPVELLEELPPAERVSTLRAVEAAARRVAAARVAVEELGDSRAGRAAAMDEAACAQLARSAPLVELRGMLRDTGEVDQLCRNCGIDPEVAFAPPQRREAAKLLPKLPSEDPDSGSEDGSTTSSSGGGRPLSTDDSANCAGSQSSGRSSPSSWRASGNPAFAGSGEGLLRARLECLAGQAQSTDLLA